MGIDLRLLPFNGSMIGTDNIFSDTVISLHRNAELFEKITMIEAENGRVVPAHFCSFLSDEGDDETTFHFGYTPTTSYGQPLIYVPVAIMKLLHDHKGVVDDLINNAAWSYLCALPDQMMVALYWN